MVGGSAQGDRCCIASYEFDVIGIWCVFVGFEDDTGMAAQPERDKCVTLLVFWNDFPLMKWLFAGYSHSQPSTFPILWCEFDLSVLSSGCALL